LKQSLDYGVCDHLTIRVLIVNASTPLAIPDKTRRTSGEPFVREARLKDVRWRNV
jgi:hypothetical protein